MSAQCPVSWAPAVGGSSPAPCRIGVMPALPTPRGCPPGHSPEMCLDPGTASGSFGMWWAGAELPVLAPCKPQVETPLSIAPAASQPGVASSFFCLSLPSVYMCASFRSHLGSSQDAHRSTTISRLSHVLEPRAGSQAASDKGSLQGRGCSAGSCPVLPRLQEAELHVPWLCTQMSPGCGLVPLLMAPFICGRLGWVMALGP